MTDVKNLVVGQEVVANYLLKQAEIKFTRTTPPKEYLDAVLGDKTGEIPVKYWDLTVDEKTMLNPMTIVHVVGVVQEYQGKLQMKINRIQPAAGDDVVNMSDFVRAAPVPGKVLMGRLHDLAEGIRNDDLRNIVRHCLFNAYSKMVHYPAAKSMHHNYMSGLAYHTNRMLAIAQFICDQRPFLNRDLLVAGIILHDIAKTEELVAEMGVVSDYSTEGKLIGHISLASLMIAEAAVAQFIDTKSEIVMALQHLVLSHHNKGEWGSPVQPQIAEAVALHLIDLLDAHLQAVEDAVDATAPDAKWTSPIRALGNRAIYITTNKSGE